MSVERLNEDGETVERFYLGNVLNASGGSEERELDGWDFENVEKFSVEGFR